MKDIKIAICGEGRVGKDTVGFYLEHLYEFTPFAFGDKLKKDFHEEFPHIPRSPKPVRAYQLYGQLMREIHGDDYWVDHCFSKIAEISNYVAPYAQGTAVKPYRPMITDLRQPNELKRLREKGYIIIRIEAPKQARMDRMDKEGDDYNQASLNFETEQFVKDFAVDHVIVNDDSISKLYERVDVVMKEIFEKASV
jgi:dephospho-CoA kinase